MLREAFSLRNPTDIGASVLGTHTRLTDGVAATMPMAGGLESSPTWLSMAASGQGFDYLVPVLWAALLSGPEASSPTGSGGWWGSEGQDAGGHLCAVG